VKEESTQEKTQIETNKEEEVKNKVISEKLGSSRERAKEINKEIKADPISEKRVTEVKQERKIETNEIHKKTKFSKRKKPRFGKISDYVQENHKDNDQENKKLDEKDKEQGKKTKKEIKELKEQKKERKHEDWVALLLKWIENADELSEEDKQEIKSLLEKYEKIHSVHEFYVKLLEYFRRSKISEEGRDMLTKLSEFFESLPVEERVIYNSFSKFRDHYFYWKEKDDEKKLQAHEKRFPTFLVHRLKEVKKLLKDDPKGKLKEIKEFKEKIIKELFVKHEKTEEKWINAFRESLRDYDIFMKEDLREIDRLLKKYEKIKVYRLIFRKLKEKKSFTEKEKEFLMFLEIEFEKTKLHEELIFESFKAFKNELVRNPFMQNSYFRKHWMYNTFIPYFYRRFSFYKRMEGVIFRRFEKQENKKKNKEWITILTDWITRSKNLKRNMKNKLILYLKKYEEMETEFGLYKQLLHYLRTSYILKKEREIFFELEEKIKELSMIERNLFNYFWRFQKFYYSFIEKDETRINSHEQDFPAFLSDQLMLLEKMNFLTPEERELRILRFKQQEPIKKYYEQYKKETNGIPVRKGKETKKFKEWLKKKLLSKNIRKEKEEWINLFENWLQEDDSVFDNKEQDELKEMIQLFLKINDYNELITNLRSKQTKKALTLEEHKVLVLLEMELGKIEGSHEMIFRLFSELKNGLTSHSPLRNRIYLNRWKEEEFIPRLRNAFFHYKAMEYYERKFNRNKELIKEVKIGFNDNIEIKIKKEKIIENDTIDDKKKKYSILLIKNDKDGRIIGIDNLILSEKEKDSITFGQIIHKYEITQGRNLKNFGLFVQYRSRQENKLIMEEIFLQPGLKIENKIIQEKDSIKDILDKVGIDYDRYVVRIFVCREEDKDNIQIDIQKYLENKYPNLIYFFKIARVFRGVGNVEFLFAADENAKIADKFMEKIVNLLNNKYINPGGYKLRSLYRSAMNLDFNKVDKNLNEWFSHLVNNDEIINFLYYNGASIYDIEFFKEIMTSSYNKKSLYSMHYSQPLKKMMFKYSKSFKSIFEKFFYEFIVRQVLDILDIDTHQTPVKIREELIEKLKHILSNHDNEIKRMFFEEFNKKFNNADIIKNFMDYFANAFEDSSNSLFPSYTNTFISLMGSELEKFAITYILTRLCAITFCKLEFNTIKFTHAIQYLVHSNKKEDFRKLIRSDTYLKYFFKNYLGLNFKASKLIKSIRNFFDGFMSFGMRKDEKLNRIILYFISNEDKNSLKPIKISRLKDAVSQILLMMAYAHEYVAWDVYENNKSKKYPLEIDVNSLIPLVGPFTPNQIVEAIRQLFSINRSWLIKAYSLITGNSMEAYYEILAQIINSDITIFQKQNKINKEKVIKRIKDLITNFTIIKKVQEKIINMFSEKEGFAGLDPHTFNKSIKLFFQKSFNEFLNNIDKYLVFNPVLNRFEFRYKRYLNVHVKSLNKDFTVENIINILKKKDIKDFYLFNDDGTIIKPLKDCTVGELANEKYGFVYDDKGNIGIMKMGLRGDRVKIIKDKTGIEYPKVQEGFYDKKTGEIIHGNYFCDMDKNYLISRIGFNINKGKFYIKKNEMWFKDDIIFDEKNKSIKIYIDDNHDFEISSDICSLFKGSINNIKSLFGNLNNKKEKIELNNILRFPFVFTSTRVTGKNLTCFMERAELMMFITNPYNFPFDIFKMLSVYKKEKNIKSVKMAINLKLINNIILERLQGTFGNSQSSVINYIITDWIKTNSNILISSYRINIPKIVKQLRSIMHNIDSQDGIKKISFKEFEIMSSSKEEKNSEIVMGTINLNLFNAIIIKNLLRVFGDSPSSIINYIIEDWIKLNSNKLNSSYGIDIINIKREVQFLKKKIEIKNTENVLKKIFEVFKKTDKIKIKKLAKLLNINYLKLMNIITLKGDELEEESSLSLAIDGDYVVKE